MTSTPKLNWLSDSLFEKQVILKANVDCDVSIEKWPYRFHDFFIVQNETDKTKPKTTYPFSFVFQLKLQMKFHLRIIGKK